jgi:hypothetical protein
MAGAFRSGVLEWHALQEARGVRVDSFKRDDNERKYRISFE